MTDTPNQRLSQQRACFFRYLEDNSQEKEMFIKAALAEGGTRGLLTNFEQMMNYGNARNFTNTHEIIHSGFFGPVNRGEAQHHAITEEELALANDALDKVRAGSNILDYRTDQGMKGDPNYEKEQNPLYRPIHLNGNFFADHPMFGAGSHSWASHQIALDHDLLPVSSEPAKVEVKEPIPGTLMEPQVSVPIQSTNLVIGQFGRGLLDWAQWVGISVATAFADQIGLLDFKGMPAYVAILAIGGIEYYKYKYLKGSNQATIDLANSVEAKLREQAGATLK